MMNPIHVDDAIALTSHEHDAVLKRLRQIAVALGHPRWTAKQSAALIRERLELERKLADHSGNGWQSMPAKIRYAEWIRLDVAGVLHVDVQLSDCGTLLPFLRACRLHFDCAELVSRGEEVIFQSGTSVDEVHAALVRFDELNRYNL